MPRVRGFRANGRPYVRARVYLPRLRAEARIRFLLDTGADRSLIHLNDRRAFDAESVRTGTGLTPGLSMSGIGGGTNDYGIEEAVYAFQDQDGALWALPGAAQIALDPAAPGLPSLLGRDILDLMLFCISDREITLDW